MKETRAKRTEVRAEGEEGEQFVSGLGIVFDVEEEIFPGLREVIKSGSVRHAESGVYCFFNHNPDYVLGSTNSKTPLELKEDKEGVHYRVQISTGNPDEMRSYARDLMINLARGDVAGSSFAFEVDPDGDRIWEDEDGVLHREINSLTLYELGPVTMPAYKSTTAELKSTLPELRKRAEKLAGAPSAEEPPVSAEARKRERELLIRHGQLRPDDAA